MFSGVVVAVVVVVCLRPVYTGDFCDNLSGDFCGDFCGDSKSPCKLATISWRFRGDFSPQNRHDFEHARVLRRFTGDFFGLRVTKTYSGVNPPEEARKLGRLQKKNI